MNYRCGRTFEHLPHKYLLGRELYRCDGGFETEELVAEETSVEIETGEDDEHV